MEICFEFFCIFRDGIGIKFFLGDFLWRFLGVEIVSFVMKEDEMLIL